MNTEMGANTYHFYTGSTRPNENTFYRRYRIEIEPLSGGTGASVTVSMKTSPTGNYTTVINAVNVIQSTPPTLRLGFNGCTGAYFAYQEVRDVVVRTPGDLSVFKTIDDCPTLTHTVIHTVVTNNMNMAVNGIAVQDTLPAHYTITGGAPTVTSGAISNFTLTNTLADGRKVYTYLIDAPANSAVDMVYTGSFTAFMPAGGAFSSGVGITVPVGFEDGNLNDNYATRSTYVAMTTAGVIAAAQSFVCNGTPASLISMAAPSESIVTYSWEKSTDGTNWTTIPNTNSADYTTDPLTQVTHFRRKAAGAFCSASESSNTVTIDNILPCLVPVNPHLRARVTVD
jgi:hypothetical protein